MPPLLSEITTRLASVSDSPALDASVLLSHILNKARTWVVSHPELTPTTDQQEKLDAVLERLESGEPLPYVLGHWEFFGLAFDITEDVLIPRPETELLVERALAWLRESPLRRPSSAHRIADVGTGSGIIAVTIAMKFPSARIFATDISPAALRVAHHNASKFNVADRFNFIECDLLPPHPKSLSTEERFDLLCANLPYIPSETLRGLTVYGREPSLALDGGADGLDLFRKLLRLAPEWMTPKSLILLEIESSLGVQVLDLAHEVFPRAEIQLHKDLAGHDRLLEIML